MRTTTARPCLLRLAALLLSLCLLSSLLAPLSALAEDQGKTVRVGWYESYYNSTDRFGRRTGYAYEYQRKIASYTGWRYEYVEASWPELMEMLVNGEIDLMSDVSYTEERSKLMGFPSYPMGTEEYYLFVAEPNVSQAQSNYAWFNGKRIGVNAGSVQKGFFLSWAETRGIQVELVELTVSEQESIDMVENGELDGYVTVDNNGGGETIIPVVKVGSSDYYFAVNKNRPDLLEGLERAMSRIQDENRYYNQMMYEKYIMSVGANLFLDKDELTWLSDHDIIRVGYLDNNLAYCDRDPATGELTGALKDWLDMAASCMANARLHFEPVSYSDSNQALQALQNGEVDCIFPVNLGQYEAETLDVSITPPLMSGEMYLVVRSSQQKDFALQERVSIAVQEGDLNFNSILLDHYPDWKHITCADTQACLKAVDTGVADCFPVSNYRINQIQDKLEGYNLTTIATGITTDSCFAVRNEDSSLYAILNKATELIPASAVNADLASYAYGDTNFSLKEFIRHNVAAILAVITFVLAVILTLLIRSILAGREARSALARIAELNREQKRQLEEIAKLNEHLSISQQKTKEALAASEQASRAKTSFLSNMSHEIRTPMNAIIGLDTIALRDESLSAHTREQLEKIGASAKHLLGLINDILDMSRIESGRMTLKQEEFSFQDLMEQINVMINGQCVDKKVTYHCSIIGKTEDYYIGDALKVKQVLINILGNAVKFTNPGGRVSFTVEQIACFEQHCTLRLVIQDTGVGMSKEYLPKIFKAFSQENEGSSNRYGSTGLGMAITKSMVSMMNGQIEVESEKGVGTTFTVTITLKASGHSVRQDMAGELLHNLRGLVVDDDVIACEHARLVAGSIGIQADIVTDGEQALELLRSKQEAGQPYQVVLTDYRMRSMNGMEFTRALRHMDNGRTAVLLMTGYNWEDKQDEAEQAGVDAVLSKPLFADSLLHSIRNALQQRKARTECETEPAPEPEETRMPGNLEGRRVLIAEDMEINAEILMDLLDLEGIQAERAENGQIAVEMFAAQRAGYYDAVLMDVRMPVMDGLEATRAIRSLARQDAKTIPIIAMTANAFDEDVQQPLQAGMSAHLSKPVEPERLFETLSSLLGET